MLGIYYLILHVNNGHLPADRRLPAPDRSAHASSKDHRQQKRHRYSASHLGLSYRTQ